MHSHTAQSQRTIGARLMPWIEGAVTLATIAWALILLIAVAAVIGFYLLAFIIVVPGLFLLFRWRDDLKKLFRRGAK